MKSKNTIFSSLIIFFLLLLSLSPNLKADSEKTSLENAQKLADAGIIVNNSSNTANYKVNTSISRREMLKIMLNLAGVKIQSNCVGKFADLPKTDWGCKYAETALNLGFIAPNKYFRPDDNVSKAESLKMIFKAKNIEVPKTTDWREGYVKKAVELGYSENFGDYDNASKRSFVFNIGAKTLDSKQSTNDLMCLQVITPAKNTKTGECVEFPNSCIPAGYEKTNSCSNETSFKKYKMSVSFADSMNKKSVEENLKIYPNIKYSSTWTDDKTLELVTNEEINKELDVLVNIYEASLKTGTKLENTITKKFKISGEAKVDFVSPEGQLTDKLQNITARFSKPIVSLTNLDNQDVCPVTISPNIPGKCVWITTSTFQFRPENGFPAGARYNVLIPAGIKTIAGDQTEKSKVFEIVTPAFAVENYSTNLNNEDKLNIIFNDEVSLSDFKNNFSISGYKNDELNFEYLQVGASLEGTFDTNKAGISILPKTGEWGYGKTFSYIIGKNMKSARGNIGLNNDLNVDITTNDILVSYTPVVFANEDAKELFMDTNFKRSKDVNIITKNNPKILFIFQKDMDLDKSIFYLNLPFTLNYVKTTDYSENRNPKIIEDKKQIVMSITGNISNNFSVKLNLSQKAKSSDKTLNFSTKQNNKIISYKQINYKKACLVSENDLGYNDNSSAFVFDKYGKVNYFYRIESYSNDADCKYEDGKNKYLVMTNLNPETDYNLNINSSFLDGDNYPLDKDYSYKFTTGKALSEDKSLSIIDGREAILVPETINPLGVSITSINISKAKVTLCEGDTNMDFENNKLILKNSSCNTKTIDINNLGFKPNITVLDLENIYGKTFTKKYVTLKVEKVDEDKGEYELKGYYYPSTSSFIFSNIGAVLKSGKSSILWLYDFNSGKNIDDEVSKIDAYKDEMNYDIFGNYKGTKTTFDKTLDFEKYGSGTYKINGNNYQKLLVTLKSGEEVFVSNAYNYADNNDRITTFLQTDKPLYKAGETVNIKGVSRILDASSYKLNTGKMSVSVRDSKYKEILNKEVTLDKNGSFDLSLTLDKDASLGNYSISALGNSINFAVEEYEKPDFKVEAKALKNSYLTSEKGFVNINANYYIGLPLANGEGKYEINAENFNFDGGKTTGYNWGINNYSLWNFYDRNYSNFYTSGDFSLDENGKYTLGLDLDYEESRVYNISTTVTDPNTKKSISTSASFISTKTNTFLGIKFDKYYYDFKDTAKIGFASVDIDGNKISSTNFKFRAYKVDYVDNEDGLGIQQKDTLLGEKTLKTDNSGITNDDFTFDNYGEYRFEIETLDGKYKTTKSIYVSGGNILKPKEAENKLEILSDKESYNVGDSAEIVISSPKKGIKALLTIEKLNEVLYSKVIDITDFNQKINIDIRPSFLPNFTIGVYAIKDVNSSTEKLEELKNIRTEMLELEKSLQKEQDNIYTIYDLKILPSINQENLDKDALTKLANLRFQEQKILNEILPEYYVGSKDIKVNLDEINLKTEVKIDKNSYLPGDKQVINLEITDKNGNPITGNVTLKIIDESLLALKNNTSSIKDYFYSENGNEIQTFSNLSNIIKRLDFSGNVKTLEENNKNSGGGGGFATETATMDDVMLGDSFGDLFSDPSATNEMAYDSVSAKTTGTDDNSTKVRTEFKDLAFYNGSVEVKNGKAQIIVPKLPDNLTTWVISGFAYTTDTKVGDFENKFKVQKDLSILPQIPRFFTNGDIANIGGLIVNNTSKDMEVSVDLNITNATSKENSKNVLVKANSSSLVEFEVEIGKSYENQVNVLTGSQNISTLLSDRGELWVRTANITLTAKSNNPLSDLIVLSKPIYPNNSGEYVFTNGSTEDLSYEEKINLPEYLEKNGYLEISLGASILTNLLQNLDKYLVFPYDDLYSKLAFLENTKTLKNIYKNAGKEKDFENIILTDYEGKTYKVSEVENLVKNDLKNYMQADNGLSYYKNCVTSYYYPSCSSFEVTGKYLELGLEIDGIDNKKVLEYYENELKTKIEKNKSFGILTTGINEFLPIAKWKDSSFIKTYFKPSESLTNTEKLEYLKLYRLLGETGVNGEKYLQELKNSLLIEARGTFLPSGNGNNSYSTSLMLETLIENGSQEKLKTENLARWILSQRNENGTYYLSDINQILKSLDLYLEKVEDLKNVSFTAKAYLNGNEFMTGSFDDSNKFSIKNEKFDLDKNINFGQENSLGFEKTGVGKLYYDVGIRYFLPTSKLEARDEGLIISRNYYDYDDYKNAFKKECFFPWWSSFRYGNYCNTIKVKNIDTINSAKKGDLIVGEVELIIDRERTNVVVKDFLPAGTEILNTNFDTTSSEVKDISGNNSNAWYGGFDYVEQKDNMIYLYASHLTPGTYKYTYVLKASYSGKYSLKPATAELLDKPEIWGRSKGVEFEVK